MKYGIISIYFLLLISTINAQTNGSISGEVRGNQESRLAGAIITAVRMKDSSWKKTLVAGEEGVFRFSGLPMDTYTLLITHTAYSRFVSKPLVLEAGHNSIQLPIVFLVSSSNNTLKEVVVTAQKKLVEVKIDRTIVNVDAMIGAAGSDALDVLKRSPGVMVDLNGGISLDGKNGVLVLIDDRPTYMSAQDLADYLRSLPAGVLDRVELMSNPPAKYEANGGAIINLVLKRNKIAGFNGNVATGVTQGVYGRQNLSLNLNYRNGKINLFGNGSFSQDKVFTDDNTQRYFYQPGQVLSNYVLLENRLINTTRGWNGRMGLDYTPASSTTIGLLLTSNFRPRQDRLDYSANQYDSLAQLDSINTGFTNTDSRWKSMGINLNLQHKLNSAGKTLSIDLDHIIYSTDGSQPSENDSYNTNGSLKNSERIALFLPSQVKIYSAKADISFPFKKGGRIDAGVKASYVRNDNEANWFNETAGINVPDYARTNHFVYEENISAAYVSLVKDWRAWSVQAGVRIENASSKGHQLPNPVVSDSSFTRSFTHLFPSLFVLRKLDKKGNNTVVFRFSTRTHRPGYQQLNPFLFYRDRYTYTAGNPALQPDYSDNFSIEYHYKQYIGLSMGYNKESATSYPVTSTVGNVFVIRPQNFTGRQNIALVPNFNHSPFQWWNLNMHLLFLYYFKLGSINGIPLPDYHINEFDITNSFRMAKTWSGEITGFFPGKQSFGQSQNQSIYRIGIGLQKNLLNNNATIRFKVDDLLNTAGNINSRTIAVNGADVFTERLTDSRRMGLSFTYRFGKQANARKSKHDKGGAEEESGRVN